jgi:hypothetical protein
MNPSSPPKRAREISRNLQNQDRELNDQLKVTKKRVKAQGAFNTAYWDSSVQASEVLIKKWNVRRDISLSEFDGPEGDWALTDAAKDIAQQIKAEERTRVSSISHLEKMKKDGKPGILRRCFMKIFTTSSMGMGIKNSGAGPRDSSMQSNFKAGLITAYNSQHPTLPWRWCPVLGCWRSKSCLKAGHLFAHMHTQETMDAIFGKTDPPELYSPRNGILIDGIIEDYLDKGKLAIVPAPELKSSFDLKSWFSGPVREYKIVILDWKWQHLDEQVVPDLELRWRDLHNRRLAFRSEFRPAARYLYFHYCVQVLRAAWQLNQEYRAGEILTKELGKPVWATPGRYIPENMIAAFVEELGHEYEDLLEGACRASGDPDLLLDTGARQISGKGCESPDTGSETDFSEAETE